MKTMDDVQSALKELFAETLQSMLEAELDTELGYEKHDIKNKTTSNSRNGKSKKTVASEYGEVEIQVPRDRNGEFEPVIVKKHQSNVSGIEDQIIAMYAKGSSLRNRRITGHDFQCHKQDRAAHQGVTESSAAGLYVVVIVNKAAYMVIGIDLDGNKDVLGMWDRRERVVEVLAQVLNDLKNRGVLSSPLMNLDRIRS